MFQLTVSVAPGQVGGVSPSRSSRRKKEEGGGRREREREREEASVTLRPPGRRRGSLVAVVIVGRLSRPRVVARSACAPDALPLPRSALLCWFLVALETARVSCALPSSRQRDAHYTAIPPVCLAFHIGRLEIGIGRHMWWPFLVLRFTGQILEVSISPNPSIRSRLALFPLQNL